MTSAPALAVLSLAIAWLGAFAGAVRAAEPVPGPIDARKVERLHLDDIRPAPDQSSFMELEVRALTRAGSPIRGLRSTDVQVWQDGQQIDADGISLREFSAQRESLAAVIALDASATMQGEPFKRAKEAAKALVQKLGRFDRVAVIAFAEDVRVVAEFKLPRQATQNALDALEIDLERSQRTLLYDAAQRSLELIRSEPALPRKTFVLLFTDGRDGGSTNTLARVTAYANSKFESVSIPVFTVAYARFGESGDGLRSLAAATGGDFAKPSLAQLPTAFDDVLTQMQGSYAVRYRTRLDGAPHTVRVSVENERAEREATYPYEAPSLWPYAAAVAVLCLLIAAAVALWRRRRVGQLRVLSGPQAGHVYPLHGGKITLGAVNDNDVVLPTRQVSRQHAVVLVRGRHVQIQDLQSLNGTRVNGTRIDTSALEPGDKIALADVELVFER